MAVLVALVFGSYQYIQRVNQEKKRQSLVFVQSFQNEFMANSRRIILEPWLEYDLERLENTLVDKSTIDEIVVKLVDTYAESPDADLRPHIIFITEYFDGVDSCIESSICDSGVIERQLGDFARDFYCLYLPALQRIKERSRLRSLGDGLREIAVRQGIC